MLGPGFGRGLSLVLRQIIVVIVLTFRADVVILITHTNKGATTMNLDKAIATATKNDPNPSDTVERFAEIWAQENRQFVDEPMSDDEVTAWAGRIAATIRNTWDGEADLAAIVVDVA